MPPIGDTRHEPDEEVIVDEREAARRRLQGRRGFSTSVLAYLVINGVLIGIWALNGRGYFWPVWVLALWGAGLILHAWEVFVRPPLTESDIDWEVRRHARRTSRR